MAALSAAFLRSSQLSGASRFLWEGFNPRRLAFGNLALPAAAVSIPSILADIWEGILKAVPKKKTSHSKRRSRFLAGKALKDTTSVVKCPACGKPKKAHTLCPYCTSEIMSLWKSEAKSEQTPAKLETPAGEATPSDQLKKTQELHMKGDLKENEKPAVSAEGR